MKHRTILALAATIALVGTVAVAGCAPRGDDDTQNAGAPTSGAQQGEAAAWSPDADCGACHAKEGSSSEETGCLSQAHVELGYACTDCHADGQALESAHAQNASATPATKLKATDVADETCLGCHESRDAIAAKTPDVALADDRGTAVNPHELTPSPDHDAIECADCHVSHEAKPALEEAQGTCASCHHAGVFECGTCHT